jgi:hypothetical protein
MLKRLSLFLVTALLRHERAEAYASVCVGPELPCEVPFTSTCIELLMKGEATTEYSLRDDDTNGGCVLCVPPGGEWIGPNPCPDCECVDGEIACFALAGGYVHADGGTAPCPPSEYEGFNDFSVVTTRCPSPEEIGQALNCGTVKQAEAEVRIVSANASLVEPTFSPIPCPPKHKRKEAAVSATSTESVADSSGEPLAGRGASTGISSILAAWLLCSLLRRELL